MADEEGARKKHQTKGAENLSASAGTASHGNMMLKPLRECALATSVTGKPLYPMLDIMFGGFGDASTTGGFFFNRFLSLFEECF